MTRKDAGWWDYAAGMLLAAVPVVGHMAYHDLGFFSIDAFGLLIPYLILGASVGWAAHRSPRWVRTILLGSLTIGFVDLQFNLESSVLPYKVFIAAGFLVAWVLREHYTRIVTLSLFAVLAAVPLRASGAVTSWETPGLSGQASALVPIVHIVFDEHVASRAFPADVREAVTARERVLAFYRRHGFRLYGNAYSRYFWTHASIPATMAGGTPIGSRVPVTMRDQSHFLVEDNRLFRWAAGQGYRIHVVQSTYLDTCSRQREQIASCRTYPANSLRSLRLLRLDVPHRLLREHVFFLSAESYLVRKFARAPPRPQTWSARAGMAVEELAVLRKRLGRGLEGSLHFAHFLFPHDPFEVDGRCRGNPSGERDAWGWIEEVRRRRRWALYAGQIECLYTQLDSLIATIDSVAPPQGVTIVFHGDHGSRNLRNWPVPERAAQLRDEDLVEGFATLLAVRGPGVRPGVDSGVVAIQDLVAALVTGDSLAQRAAVDRNAFVFLERFNPGGERPIRFPAPALARLP